MKIRWTELEDEITEGRFGPWVFVINYVEDQDTYQCQIEHRGWYDFKTLPNRKSLSELRNDCKTWLLQHILEYYGKNVQELLKGG